MINTTPSPALPPKGLGLWDWFVSFRFPPFNFLLTRPLTCRISVDTPRLRYILCPVP